MNRYVFFFLSAVLLSAFGQIALKKGAMREDKTLFKQFLNPWAVLGYSILLTALVVNSIAYRGVSLKIGPVLDATGFFFVPCLSCIFFKERITKRKFFGFILIFLGILFF